MTLYEMKKKVLGLIEELNPNSELLTDDPDIAAKIEEGIRKVAETGEVGESFELDEEFDLSGLDEE